MSPFGKLQLTLIDYPSGRFGFVGTVPHALAVDNAYREYRPEREEPK